MTQYRKAQVTITATVFISEQELQDELRKDEDLLVDNAFMKLALAKIDTLFPTDDVLRVREVDIDMETFE